MPFHRTRICDDQGGSTVVDARRITGRHCRFAAEQRLQAGETFKRGVRARMFVLVDIEALATPAAGDADGHDLFGMESAALRSDGTLLTA